MQIKVKLDEGAIMPKKAYEADAGFDLFSRRDVLIPPHFSYTFDTGVHMKIPEGYCGVLVSKSGLNIKHGLNSTGLVDATYVGSIRVKLNNDSYDEYHIKEGDKISQIVILPIPEVELIEVDELGETERGSNGFGSSGR